MTRTAAPTIAGCFALAAFSVAIVAGLAAGNGAGAVMTRAIIALLVCYPVGLGVGLAAQWLVDQQANAHREANPAPDVPDDAPRGGAADEDGDEDVLVV